MTPAVTEAVEELKKTYGGSTVTVNDDSSGGAFIVIEPVDPGAPYVQRATWLGFQITFQYPYSDVYPLFVREDLARTDGAALGEGFGVASFCGRPATQLSRRSNRLNPAIDTAALKVAKVLEWLWTR
jgi:hypothetical protein